MCATGEPPLDKAATCKAWHEKRLGTRAQDAERYGLPLIISEFGACLGTESCSMEINAVGDSCDNHLLGWAYWQFKNYADLTTSAGTHSEGFYNVDGTLQTSKVKALTRTYLPATQGVLKSVGFDVTSGLFNATFTVDTSITSPSLAYYSFDLWYPNGIIFSLTDVETGVILQADGTDFKLGQPARGYSSFQVVNENLNGKLLRVDIKPKTSSKTPAPTVEILAA